MWKIEKKYKLFEVSWKGKLKECGGKAYDTHEEALAELERKNKYGEAWSAGQYVILEVYVKGWWES